MTAPSVRASFEAPARVWRGCDASPAFDDKRKQSSLAQFRRHQFPTLDSLLKTPDASSLLLPTASSINFLLSLPQARTDRRLAYITKREATKADAPCLWPKPLLHQCASSLPRTCTTPSPSQGYFVSLKTRSTTMRPSLPTSIRPKSSRVMRRRARTSWSSACAPQLSRALQKAP